MEFWAKFFLLQFSTELFNQKCERFGDSVRYFFIFMIPPTRAAFCQNEIVNSANNRNTNPNVSDILTRVYEDNGKHAWNSSNPSVCFRVSSTATTWANVKDFVSRVNKSRENPSGANPRTIRIMNPIQSSNPWTIGQQLIQSEVYPSYRELCLIESKDARSKGLSGFQTTLIAEDRSSDRELREEAGEGEGTEMCV